MLKVSVGVVLIGCVVALVLAISAPHKQTKASALQNKEEVKTVAIKNEQKPSVEPSKDVKQDAPVEKKKSPFGKKAKMPTGKQLLETNRKFVKAWKVEDLLKEVSVGLTNRDFERGKKLYSEAKCVLCHTYGQDEGGFVGPALTDVGARFSAVDILYSTLEPNKVVADAYVQRTVELDDGRVFTGLVSHMDNDLQIIPDILDPDRKIIVSQDQVVSTTNREASPMPEGLINTLDQEEIFDLIAFVISRNDREDEMFRPSGLNK